ncbi:MAG: hypothetical protein ACRDQ5_21095, partial [Sciscionella sp.]
GTLDDYLAALALARGIAEHETDHLVAAGRPAVTIAAESRYAVLAANMIRSDAIPATLLDALARTGVWDVDRALWHAHRKLDPQSRAKALTALALQVDDDHPASWTRAEVLADALDAARAIRLDWYRPAALAEVAVLLPEPARTGVLDEGLTTAVTIADGAYRQRAFEAVVRHLTDPGQLRHATEAALAFGDDAYRAEALAVVAPRLPEPDRSRLLSHAVDVVRTVTRPVPAARVLTELAAVVSEPVRQQVLERAFDAALTTPTWGGYRATAIARLAEATNDPAQLDRSLTAALEITESDERAATLATIASGLPEPSRASVLRQALDTATTTGNNDRERATALLAVAVRMSEPARTRVLGQCLGAASAVSGIEHRGWALADIAKHLMDPAQVSRALDIALLAEDHGNRTTAMTKIAAHVNEPAPLGRVLDAGRAMPADWGRADAVTTIAAGLTDPALLAQAAGIARAIADPGPRARTLAAVAVRMAEPARTGVIDETFAAIEAAPRPWDRTRALRTMATEATRQRQLVDAALAITDAGARWEALIAVADQLAEPARTPVLNAAAVAARDVRDWDRAVKLAGVATRLSGSEHTALTAEILNGAVTETSDLERSRALVSVADQLTEPDQLDRALDAALACAKPDSRAKALAAVAARLPEPSRTGLLGRALDTAVAVPDPRDRAWALYEVANQLTDPDHLGRAVDAAFAVAGPDWVFAACAAARRLPEPQRHHALDRVLDRATADINRSGPAERQLSAIAENLTNPDHFAKALDVALGLEPDMFSGAGAWTAVFRQVAKLDEDMAPKDVVRLLRQAFHALPRTTVMFDIIGAAAAATARIGGQQALTGQLDLFL